MRERGYMKAGFTGCQEMPTFEQIAALSHLLRFLGVTELHHGDCIGSDAEAHLAATNLDISMCIHPPRSMRKRAFCKGAAYTYPVAEYLVLNKNIVDCTDILIGMPNTTHEKQRSGTWSTLRYAKKRDKPAFVIWPDGDVTKGWGRSRSDDVMVNPNMIDLSAVAEAVTRALSEESPADRCIPMHSILHSKNHVPAEGFTAIVLVSDTFTNVAINLCVQCGVLYWKHVEPRT